VVIIGRATLGRKQLGGERVLSVEFLVLSYTKGGDGGNCDFRGRIEKQEKRGIMAG
jgi:hypothetical protein